MNLIFHEWKVLNPFSFQYDAEIMYWETKTKEQQHQMEILAKDAARVDAALKQVDEQVMTLNSYKENIINFLFQ